MHADEIVKVAKEYQPKGVAMVAISSNSMQTHPQVRMGKTYGGHAAAPRVHMPTCLAWAELSKAFDEMIRGPKRLRGGRSLLARWRHMQHHVAKTAAIR